MLAALTATATSRNLIATGEPGTHLIDLYPAIYKGRDRVPFNYQTPFLTYTRDFPALTLGHRYPAYRLAIEVIKEPLHRSTSSRRESGRRHLPSS